MGPSINPTIISGLPLVRSINAVSLTKFRGPIIRLTCTGIESRKSRSYTLVRHPELNAIPETDAGEEVNVPCVDVELAPVYIARAALSVQNDVSQDMSGVAPILVRADISF